MEDFNKYRIPLSSQYNDQTDNKTKDQLKAEDIFDNQILICDNGLKEGLVKVNIMKKQNEYLKKQINSNNKIIIDYQNKCSEQKTKIKNLKNKILDLQEKQNQIIKQKEKKLEEKLNQKAIEKELMNQIMENNYYNKKENDPTKIKDMYFNSNTANFFECGICMDVFTENEKVQKLSCGHIFHKECLNQWSLSQKICPLCGEKTIPNH